MGFDGQQHVAEAPEHVGADDFAFVGAANLAHIALVRRDAEMVRPEPDEPLDKPDLGAERGIDAGLGFGEINLLRHAGTRPRCRCRRRGGLILRLRRASATRRISLLGGALRLPRRALRLLIGERGTRGCAARQQLRIVDATGARAIQFGQQRPARIRRNARDRSSAWTEAEPMQGERSSGFRIKGHAVLPTGCEAAGRQQHPSAAAKSRLRQSAFRNHGREMTNWKGSLTTTAARSGSWSRSMGRRS